MIGPDNGVWTIGFYGICPDVICNFATGDNFKARVAVSPLTVNRRPLVALVSGKHSAYFDVPENGW